MSEADDLVWKALADPVRRALLDALRSGPRTTGALSAPFPQTRFGVMKHLDVLRAAGLVTVERRGRERWNHLNGVAFERALSRWLTSFQSLWSNRLAHLSNYLDEEPAMSESARDWIEIRQEVELPWAPENVFRALTRDVDRWWTSPFRQTQGTSRLELFPEIGAAMIERGAGAHDVVWARVEEIQPPAKLYLSGRFGMIGVVSGRIHYDLFASDKGTRLVLTHQAIGRITEETERNFSQGWSELLDRRLRAHLDGGIDV